VSETSDKLDQVGVEDAGAEDAPEASDTSRLEAFSDGVFAVATTLLVLDLHVPSPEDLKLAHAADVFAYMSLQWPHYLAYLTSFLFILVMWINHHTLFKLIGRTDNLLMLFNGLLLLCVTLVPFSTSLLASSAGEGAGNQHEAAVVYNGLYIVIAILFNILWRHAAHERRLLDAKAHPAHVAQISAAYRFGPLYYVAALLLALLRVEASLLLNIALAIYFALPRAQRRR
jgi:uncharacterized membrane protein